MNTTEKTVLITGGGSGIGFQIAKLFSEKGNKVIITGRNEQKLKEAAAQLNNVDYFVADVKDDSALDILVDFIGKKYGGLDILINNAAVINFYQLGAKAGAYKIAQDEVATNFLSVVNLTEKLLPLLDQKSEAAIININAILGLAPSVYMPTHSATKAALRSYTQALRLTLETSGSKIKIFEVLPPLVATEFSAPAGSMEKGIPAEQVAQELLQGLENNKFIIPVGMTEKFYQGFFSKTDEAVAALNQAS
jgi:uncharacterized oxidoreductase